MPLKLGTWNMNNNGFETELTLISINAENLVQGTIGRVITGAITPEISGYWDETSKTFTFGIRAEGYSGGGLFLPLLYKGYLFSTPLDASPGQDIVWTLTGFFQASSPVITPNVYYPRDIHARRNTFGWFAQITEVA